MPAGPAPEEKWSIFLLAPASLLYYSVFLPPPKIGFDLHRRYMPPPQSGKAGFTAVLNWQTALRR